MPDMEKLQLPDGGYLAYDDYDFTPPWRQSEPVVLVHGFSKHRRYWFEFIPHIAQHFRVICPDWRGHGDSSPFPADFRMGLRPFSDDLAALVDGLGLESAHFVMAEFSSAIALDFAVAYPDRIRSLVLPGFTYNTDTVPWQAWEALVREGGTPKWARETNNVRLLPNTDPAKKEWYIREQGRFPTDAFLKFIAFGKQPLNLAPNLPKIKAPTLIIAGAKAIQESPENVRLAARTIPNCSLRMLEGMPFNVISACPEVTIAETLAFLKANSAKISSRT
jgi:pimeloyl-ACP methyl ester carboxylesterase